jgi:hypothetical protein
VIYTIEMTLKILGMGFVLNRGSYLRDRWNLLDFIIVVSAWIPYMFEGGGAGLNLNGLRSLRVLRPLKTVTAIKKLRSLILAIFSAIPYLLDIMIVLVFAFLIFAIAGLQLFSGLLLKNCFHMESGRALIDSYFGTPVLCGGIIDCPANFTCAKSLQNPDYGTSNFDTLMSSFLMVYVVTTLEGWTAITGYVSSTFTQIIVFFFLLIVFICSFFLMNLTLAVITIKFNEAQANAKAEELMLKKHGTASLTQLLMTSSLFCQRLRFYPSSRVSRNRFL